MKQRRIRRGTLCRLELQTGRLVRRDERLYLCGLAYLRTTEQSVRGFVSPICQSLRCGRASSHAFSYRADLSRKLIGHVLTSRKLASFRNPNTSSLARYSCGRVELWLFVTHRFFAVQGLRRTGWLSISPTSPEEKCKRRKENYSNRDTHSRTNYRRWRVRSLNWNRSGCSETAYADNHTSDDANAD